MSAIRDRLMGHRAAHRSRTGVVEADRPRRSLRTRSLVSVIAIVAGLSATLVAVPGAAVAAPNTSRIVKVENSGGNLRTVSVYSAAMRTTIEVQVLVPRNQRIASPVFYLLNGAGGGEDGATWAARTDYRTYFADKQTYVVTPVGGAASYYTDWVRTDRSTGRPVKWQTFLTKELPPLINAQFNTTGRNAIAGISMSGTSVFNLAIAAPGLYSSIGAFSGCARTTDPAGQAYVRLVVESFSKRKVTDMWGPIGGPLWRANDPYLNAAKLRGTKIHMTSGSGLPGVHENLNDPSVHGDPAWLANQAVVGGILEAAVDQCTKAMTTRLAQLRIPADVTLRSTGSHSWGYWQDDLHRTWPKIAADLR